jgi:hypothetical protein
MIQPDKREDDQDRRMLPLIASTFLKRPCRGSSSGHRPGAAEAA